MKDLPSLDLPDVGEPMVHVNDDYEREGGRKEPRLAAARRRIERTCSYMPRFGQSCSATMVSALLYSREVMEQYELHRAQRAAMQQGPGPVLHAGGLMGMATMYPFPKL